MSLQIRRKKDGTLASNYWYADYQVDGKRHIVPLGIEIAGRIPISLKKAGSKKFERSRGDAQAEHDRLLAESRKKGATLKILERIVDIRTEGESRSLTVGKLADAWSTLSRRRKPSVSYLAYGRGTLGAFVTHLERHHKGTKTLSEVTMTHIKEFMDSQDKLGITSRTWNAKRTILKAAFCHLDPSGDVCRRLSGTLPERDEDTVHRQPFSKEEIDAILDAAKDDDLLRPLIVTALSTAMRRGDCARLTWNDVDMNAKFIRVKSTKTQEIVEIPIMHLLYTELETAAKRNRSHGPRDYVFPEAAAIYKRNADGLNLRLRHALVKAGFVDQKVVDREDKAKKAGLRLPVLPPAQLRERGLNGIEALKITGPKREHMRAIFLAYLDGATFPKIHEKLGVGQGTASAHLNQLEKHIGAAVVRRRLSVLPEKIRGTLHSSHAKGERLKRGSLRGWHAFRTTFITLALSAGMPMELVQRITGHTTVSVVMKHYFRPNRDHFRQALQAAMPQLLTASDAKGQG